ncbi:hypothetical protein K32_30940 [Kaistia sp. 32K]|uniref:nuclear transport factor 2 family protein n=1 Tax=Kaistia sp. 32K TaxID=2795690 RepID=UPI001915AEA2|nr:nuclear transport factor 2 family protein [Kaistia sp. 32K]BCP54477.1 hypothetical protein K32_30940 [Kaistia sp. 32K]
MNGSADAVRALVEELFRRTGSGAAPETIAELFSEDVDWYIAGDVALVPWIGRKKGRAGAAEFYRQIRALIGSERFELSEILVAGDRAIAVGSLASRVLSTGKLIETEFAFDLTMADGLIRRFRMFEDSFAVAQAAA